MIKIYQKKLRLELVQHLASYPVSRDMLLSQYIVANPHILVEPTDISDRNNLKDVGLYLSDEAVIVLKAYSNRCDAINTYLIHLCNLLDKSFMSELL